MRTTKEHTLRRRSAVLRDRHGERGAVLVHVAIALVALLAFNGLVVDYGVLWLARRQAQNAADAAAMSGAISLGYVDFDNKELARTAAINTAKVNYVFGEEPDIVSTDVTFPLCPPKSPGEGTDGCIRVDVYRNQRPGGNPLPMFFGNLFGVTTQGVKATATAEVLWGGSAECIKPFAISDKWLEKNPVDVLPEDFWDEPREFNAYDEKTGARLAPADLYEPPQVLQPEGVINTTGEAGTGYTPKSITDPNGDYGRELVIKNGSPSGNDPIAPGWYALMALSGRGEDTVYNNIVDCNTERIGPGFTVDVDNEPGNKMGQVVHGIEVLMGRENVNAHWDTTLQAPVGCNISDESGICLESSRMIAIPVYNPDEYQAGKASGRQTVQITKVIGFWLEGIENDGTVTGRIMYYPTTFREGDDVLGPESGFAITIALVR